MQHYKTLEQWIARVITDPSAEAPCTAIALVHMQGMIEDECHVARFGNGSTPEPRALANMFRNMAEETAQDMSGAQTFKLLAFYGGANEASTKRPFVVEGRYGEDGVTEPPTAKGTRAQEMRITEALVTGTFKERAMIISQYQELTSMLAQQLATVSKENVDAIQVVKEMILTKAKEDRDADRQLEEYKRSTAERKRLLELLPPAANQLFGREIFPQSTADSALIDSIADSLTVEQFQAISGVLRPEQMALLSARLTQGLEKRRLEFEAAQARPNEVEEDATDVTAIQKAAE